MPSSAVSCPATRCGSMSKRSTMRPPRGRTAGAAPRSRCGCPAWKSCAPRPARRRVPSRARLIRCRRRNASSATGRATSPRSGAGIRTVARPDGLTAGRGLSRTARCRSNRRSAPRKSRAIRPRCRSAFQNRLREVQELLQRALTPELEQRLRELQEALARLDPEATRQALQRLAEAQQELRRELERSQELFKRAALEGELASLAKDAEDLQRRQTEWTKDEAQHPDSAAAAAERDLAAATDSLARGVERAGETVPLQQSQAAARRAQRAMQEAASAASQRDSRGARASGQEAADSLAQLPNELRQRRDSLASAWKQET